MTQGKIVEQATADAIYNNPQHPYTKRLLEAVPSL
jgi:oligopeptide/dipeptide ABC transporter ATP-binding protein